jgi:uncharacterized membrane protein
MQIELESSLHRWLQAAILGPEQAARIRDFEAARAPGRATRTPILIGLALGGIMLAAGVLLFVAAHWSDLSPVQRMALLVFALGAFHTAAAFSSDRALATTLHATGTVALGGAIFLAGQIFNLQENWPTGVLLWAIGALAGWWLLRDWPQLALAALLIPGWLIGQWSEAMSNNAAVAHVTGAFCCLLAICYLSLPAAPFRWIGGISVLPSVLILALNFDSANRQASLSGPLGVTGWIDAFLLPLGFAILYRKSRVWMNVVAAGWVGVLSTVAFPHNSIWIYAWCAIGSAGMIGWGIYEFRAERVNLGMVGFALTILFFYFSSVMDKLGRSTSLIVLGIVFLGGAWCWEKLRRRLIARVQSGGAA